jgi:hypothetical protein
MNHKRELDVDFYYTLIGKAKLPKGLSFPIKSSALDLFLRREGIMKVTGVGYCGSDENRVVLRADFYGPRSKSSRHTLNLWIYAVPSEMRRSVEEVIVSETLPLLAEWLLSFNDDTLLRAKTDHSTTFALEGASGGDQSASSVGSGGLRLVQSTGQGRMLK